MTTQHNKSYHIQYFFLNRYALCKIILTLVDVSIAPLSLRKPFQTCSFLPWRRWRLFRSRSRLIRRILLHDCEYILTNGKKHDYTWDSPIYPLACFPAFHDTLLRQIVPTKWNNLFGFSFNLWHGGSSTSESIPTSSSWSDAGSDSGTDSLGTRLTWRGVYIVSENFVTA
jgi:hypothetical protein